MSSDDKPLMEMAYDERADLAAFLETLTPQEWHVRSLCTEWTVKDVVAHVVSYEDLSPFGLAKRFAKGWVLHSNEVGVEEFAPMSPQELMDFLSRHLRPRGLTAGFGGMVALVDGTIHQQDIRRSLGHPRLVPVDRLERILPLVPGNPRLGAGRRIRGLRLTAADVDWRHGDGPEVSGTGEALLMAMAGRPDALNELAGPGQATLAGRLGHATVVDISQPYGKHPRHARGTNRRAGRCPSADHRRAGHTAGTRSAAGVPACAR